MIITILSAFCICKIKKLRLKYIFTSWYLYPFFAFEAIHIFFQIFAFSGNYIFVSFAPYFKTGFMLSLVLPIFFLSLYKPGFVGAIFILIGTFLNKLAIHFNNGKMPVFPYTSYLTGYVKRGSFGVEGDFHILGSAATKVPFLTDIFDVGYSILSVGDLFIRVHVIIIIYFTVKALNELYVRKDSL